MALNWLVCLSVAFCANALISADTGTLKTCGGSEVKLQWSPATLTAGKQYSIAVNGSANVGFTHGKVATQVKQGSQSIWDNTQDFTCTQLAAYSPIKLKCPVKKGDVMNSKFSEKLPDIASVVPTGSYTVHLEAMNENGDKFLCLEGEVKVNNP